jgi:hypothetical protein
MKRIISLVAVALVMAAMMVAMAMPAVAATPLYTCPLVRFDGASGDLPDPTAKDIARLKKALDHGGLTSVTCTRQVKSLTA